MAFMVPEYHEGVFFLVEDRQGGTSVVPDTVAGAAPTLADLAEYTESGEPESFEEQRGVGVRLSASGYLEQTEWSVFDTEKEARFYVMDYYEVDPDSGNDNPHEASIAYTIYEGMSESERKGYKRDKWRQKVSDMVGTALAESAEDVQESTDWIGAVLDLLEARIGGVEPGTASTSKESGPRRNPIGGKGSKRLRKLPVIRKNISRNMKRLKAAEAKRERVNDQMIARERQLHRKGVWDTAEIDGDSKYKALRKKWDKASADARKAEDELSAVQHEEKDTYYARKRGGGKKKAPKKKAAKKKAAKKKAPKKKAPKKKAAKKKAAKKKAPKKKAPKKKAAKKKAAKKKAPKKNAAKKKAPKKKPSKKKR